MSIFKKLFSKKKQYSVAEKELIEMKICPSCWGWQEYQDIFHDESVDLNHDKSYRKIFIQKFVEKNITGVKLKSEGKRLSCPTCKKGYRVINDRV